MPTNDITERREKLREAIERIRWGNCPTEELRDACSVYQKNQEEGACNQCITDYLSSLGLVFEVEAELPETLLDYNGDAWSTAGWHKTEPIVPK